MSEIKMPSVCKCGSELTIHNYILVDKEPTCPKCVRTRWPDMGKSYIDILEARIAELEQPQAGHWTKEPPTKPGLYLAIYYNDYFAVRDCIVLEIKDDEYIKFRVGRLSGSDIGIIFDLIEQWYSKPIALPEPPGEEDETTS